MKNSPENARPQSGAKSKNPDKKEKLAAALRRNLQRRKQAARKSSRHTAI